MSELCNALASAQSPYLRQHAHQPVAWQVWNEATLARARELDRPILLSIGYSTCHWCHVMAHECFDDPSIAAVLNRDFVCIKVDREERPDLDQIYQTAHQLLTGRAGGWPLTLFLTPRGVPFFAGTYFPKTARFGLPSFPDLCERIAELWRHHRADIEAHNQKLLAALTEFAHLEERREALSSAQAAERLERALLEVYDRRHGGFGRAPKFPRPTELAFLLGRAHPEARGAALHTLEAMAAGGIHDHLGGGFFRYSVDERWEIPHFEKMLYDNAQLLDLYALAAAQTGEKHFRRIAEGIVAWMERELQAPSGSFHCALDADSGGGEGRYYLWRQEEIARLLSPAEYAVAMHAWGLDAPANFEGYYHLRQARPVDELQSALLATARAKLFAARKMRTPPAVDDKILTSWNALAAAALLRAARRLGVQAWADLAERALDDVIARRWKEGRLMTTDALPGYLDDYAFLLEALLERMQWRFQRSDYELAKAIADAIERRFEDPAGGFFFTSSEHEPLLLRLKIVEDNAMPAGYAIAVRALSKLAALSGEFRYREAAERALACMRVRLERHPLGHATLVCALEEALHPLPLLVLRGAREALAPWQVRLRAEPIFMILLPSGCADLPAPLAYPESEAVNAWLCTDVRCQGPFHRPEDVEKILDARAKNENENLGLSP